MIDPLFWLGLSILLVAASLTAVLVAAIPALQELSRAARSAEKLFDTLSRELPPTLDAIRMTSLEITDLTDDVSEGVKNASQIVKQVDQSLEGARKQAQSVQVGTRSFVVGIKAAWKTFTRHKSPKRTGDRFTSQRGLTLRERETLRQHDNRRITNDAYRNGDGYNNTSSWENNFDNSQDLLPKSKISEDWSNREPAEIEMDDYQ